MSTQIIWPVMAQAALTFVLLFRLGPARFGALRRGEVRLADVALGQNAWPARITQLSNSFSNQFQMPVLFYVAAMLALVTRTVDPLMTGLAWAFVALRALHAAIHVTTNRVQHRFYAFLAGVVVLIAMWVLLAVRLPSVTI